MAENNTYHLYVHFGGGGEKKSAVSNNSANKNNEPEISKTEQGAMNALEGMVSYAAVRAFANNLISYEISQVELRTGAREYEQKLRFGYDVANKVINIGTATVMGGLAGGPIGAAVGFLGSTFYTALGYMQNANTLRTQQNLEDISIGMANIRAGVSGRRGANQ